MGETQDELRCDPFTSAKGMSAVIELVITTLLTVLLFFAASRMFSVPRTAGLMKKASWSSGGGIWLLMRGEAMWIT